MGLSLRAVAHMLQMYVAQAPRSTTDLKTLARDLPQWLRSQGRNGLDDGMPWVAFAAQRELAKIVGRGARVFEYGSGGSTVFFSQRAAEVVSVEHDPEWYEQVRRRLSGRAELILAPPTADAPGPYTSTGELYQGLSFRDYASAIDTFPDGYFTVLFIDGRARPSCFTHGRRKVHPGGWIVLDNSDRPEYASIVQAARAAGWREQQFIGPVPYVPSFEQTTIWSLYRGI